MGRTIYGLLCYGFPVVSVDDDDDDRTEPKNWFEQYIQDIDGDNDEGVLDFEDWAVAKLAGNKPIEIYTLEWKTLWKSVPVELDSYGYSEYSQWALVVKASVKKCHCGDTELISDEHLTASYQKELERGCEMLGIPCEPGKWILGVYSD